jgi:hypothetical protein
MRRPAVSALIGGWFLAAAAVAPAQAQNNDFHCPKSGTTVKTAIAENGVEYTQVYRGADQNDPEICRLTISTTVPYTPRARRRLFNFFDVPTMADMTEVRPALRSLLSGQTNRMTFRFTAYDSDRRGPWPWQETWQRLGHETIPVGGRNIDAVTFERESENVYTHSSHAKIKLWFDPATGIFLKDETTILQGQWGHDYQVTSIEFH